MKKKQKKTTYAPYLQDDAMLRYYPQTGQTRVDGICSCSAYRTG